MNKLMATRLRKIANTGDENFLEIIKHAFWAMLLLGSTTGIQFIFDLSLSRNFRAHGTGVFYLCFSVVMILALIGRLGLDQAVVRFIPPLLRKKPAQAGGVKRSAVVLSLTLTLPISTALFLLAPYLANNIFNSSELVFYLRVFAFGIPPLAINYIFSGVLRSLKRTQAALSIERLTMYSLGILCIFTIGRIYGLKGVVIGFVLAIYASSLLGMYYIRKNHPRYDAIAHFSKKTLLLTAGPLLFVAFATQLSGQASVLILGAYSSNADVGIFNVALKISMLMTMILAAINVIAATKFSELYASGKKRELEITISKISALGTLIGVPMFIFIAFFSELLLGFFGEAFVVGSSTLIILTAGQLVNVSAGSTNYVLAMTGNERPLALAVGSALLINIVLGFMLIPRYELMGAGITAATTIAASNVFTILMVRRYLGVWQLPFKHLRVWGANFKKSKDEY